MSLKQTVQSIIEQCRALKNDPKLAEKNKLPGDAFFLEDESVLCLPREDGEARYPYSHDGFNLWAYASGTMYLNESTFTPFLQMPEGSEPKIAFFAGLPMADGSFLPVSLLGVPAQPPTVKAERYTVFTPKAVYYITETAEVDFAVRVFVTSDKEVFFSLFAQNKSKERQKLYLSSYFNPFLRYGDSDNAIFRWWKECRVREENFEFLCMQDMSRTASVSNYGLVVKQEGNIPAMHSEQTASRINYMGGKNTGFLAAEPLIKGRFKKAVQVCGFTDIAVAGDISHYEIPAEGALWQDFCFAAAHDEKEAEIILSKRFSREQIDKKLETLEQEDRKNQKRLTISFGEFEDHKIKGNVFESFLEYVKRQIEFCALGKTYGGDLLGIRDVFQHLEALVIWRPEACAKKILEALCYTAPNGRCPRQYSIPAKDEAPKMDLRAFIDQGVWVISTIVTYLKYTGDFEFLNCSCGYYEIIDEESHSVKKSDLVDSVLDHMLKIMDYLIDNRDKEYTKCVCALFGDWNDALDGLGVSQEPGKKYGTGVSVMATLQVYQNLNEMIELLCLLDEEKYKAEILKYRTVKEEIAEGLKKYAIVENEEGRKHILHGWGDQRSYLVGGFDDPDGVERYGLTASAFWVLSGFYDLDPTMKNTILETYQKLDSKYGLKTFDQYFPVGTHGVGRIPKLPAGTAENAAAYIHGSMFGIASLFRIGEGKEAWRQLEKSLPITHEKISVTPFVMPNSYCYNEELEVDGESMSDWHTGSANVLLKTLMRYGFGIEPQYYGLVIEPCAYMPVKEFELKFEFRGCKVSYYYRNQGNDVRKFIVNGKNRNTELDKIHNTPRLLIENEYLMEDNLHIEIID